MRSVWRSWASPWRVWVRCCWRPASTGNRDSKPPPGSSRSDAASDARQCMELRGVADAVLIPAAADAETVRDERPCARLSKSPSPCVAYPREHAEGEPSYVSRYQRGVYNGRGCDGDDGGADGRHGGRQDRTAESEGEPFGHADRLSAGG